MPEDHRLEGAIRYSPERGEWYGMVVLVEPNERRTVLTVGVEDTEEEIMVWIENTIAIMKRERDLTMSAPDRLDRERGKICLH